MLVYFLVATYSEFFCFIALLHKLSKIISHKLKTDILQSFFRIYASLVKYWLSKFYYHLVLVLFILLVPIIFLVNPSFKGLKFQRLYFLQTISMAPTTTNYFQGVFRTWFWSFKKTRQYHWNWIQAWLTPFQCMVSSKITI